MLYRACRVVMNLYRGMFAVLPETLFRGFSTLLLRSVVLVIFPRGRIVKNLNVAYGPSVSWADQKELARGVQSNLAGNIQDCLSQWLCPEGLRSKVSIRGLENLEAALSRGRGVITLGAHLGNFILVGARLGMQGYPFHSLIRIPEDPVARAFIEEHVAAFHQTLVPSIPRREAVDRIIEILRKNQIVYILVDNFKRGRVPAVFFHQPVLTSRGPVTLALRSGAPLLPMYLIRNRHGELELCIEPEIPLTRSGSLGKDVTANTCRLVAHLEKWVRRYPDQWNWLTVRLGEKAPSGRSGSSSLLES